MCGIAGYFGTRDIKEQALQKSLSLMHHRGPDFAAVKSWTNPAGRNVYLLHSRLSIIDLDPRANQPLGMASNWIVFNGEIYNYKELKKEPSLTGVPMHTESDTEVLLALLAREGPTALQRCEGMWAFALYNEKDGSIILSRDRFGEKPLYVYQDDTGVYFASEVKFIVALLGRPLLVNINHLYRFMINGYKSLYKSNACFFQGLEEVPAATTWRFSAEGVKTSQRYWTPRFLPDENMSYATAVKTARERLIQSVQLRLRADIPLAFCMSGGVDSNSLISIAKNIFNYDVHAFTIVNSDARYEEQDMVEEVVKTLKIHHTGVPVNQDNFLPQLKALVRQHDAPVHSISYYAHWQLMGMIAKHKFHISVSGTAADELFSGYYDHHLAYLYDVRNDAPLHTESKDNWARVILPYIRNPQLKNSNLYIDNSQWREHVFDRYDLSEGSLKAAWKEPFTEQHYSDSLLRNRMLNEMFHEGVPVILHEDDLNAMAFSIENRSPFLDRSLFEFCGSIPTRHLVKDGLAKAILRDAMRGIVPEIVLNNPRKVGFNAPLFSYLDMKSPETRSYLFDNSPIYEHVRRETIESLGK